MNPLDPDDTPSTRSSREPFHQRRSNAQGSKEGQAEILTEVEVAHGWSYEVVLHHLGGTTSEHTVSLAWCDHDYWSGGRLAPSRVIQTVLEYAISHLPAGFRELPKKFDAARLRRICTLLDSELRSPHS